MLPPSRLLPCARVCAATLLAVFLLASCAAPKTDTPAPVRPGAQPQPVPVPVPAPAPSANVPVAAPASDVTEAAHREAFLAWVNEFRASARAAGVGEATLEAALREVRFLPRVIELDGAQPEFTRSVWDYLDRAVTAQRVTRGQEMLQRVRTEAPRLSASLSVPAEVVVAIWGMESNYGDNYGETPTIDALATLAFEGRRASWARGELLAALRILERGDIARDRMIGSWAGAMGQTQFLPSSYLSYAVDGDGDGRRDIWGSLPDVVASTANFLARAGWQAPQPWGVEVRLPPGFDHGRADASVRQPSDQWAAEGVTSIDRAPLPALNEASVLLPAGARGPAFLTGPNFQAILRYNNSTSYALAVGLLARQLTGGSGVQTPWPRDLETLSRTDVRQMQEALARRGFPSGVADGIVGPATRDAVRAYQRSLAIPADGFPSAELLQRLQPR